MVSMDISPLSGFKPCARQQTKPSQAKPSQAKASQAKPSQAKPSQAARESKKTAHEMEHKKGGGGLKASTLRF
jgi:hypothetical protein